MIETEVKLRKNLRDAAEFSQLLKAIKERSSNTQGIDYFPSPGNWGDSLINAGASQILGAGKIDVHPMTRNQMYESDPEQQKGRLALVGGGGGWNRNWPTTASFANDVAERYHHVIVLPSSFDPRLVEGFPRSNTTLVSRAAGASATIADFVCHDLAFYLQVNPTPPVEEIPYPLICLRRDKERNHSSVSPDRNCDISLLGSAENSHFGFLSLVERFGQIYTDRLHVAIAGAILGKQVVLLDGNYGKNAGVHSLSFANNYPNVALAEWSDIDWDKIVGATRIGAPGY